MKTLLKDISLFTEIFSPVITISIFFVIEMMIDH